MDLWGVKLQSHCCGSSYYGQRNESMSTMFSWLTKLSTHPQVVSWSSALTFVGKNVSRFWYFQAGYSLGCMFIWAELVRRQALCHSHLLLEVGMCVSRALVAFSRFASSSNLPAGARNSDTLSQPPPLLSHCIALWLSLIFTLPSFHLCHFHSLLIAFFFVFYFFICFSFSCFISGGRGGVFDACVSLVCLMELELTVGKIWLTGTDIKHNRIFIDIAILLITGRRTCMYSHWK